MVIPVDEDARKLSIWGLKGRCKDCKSGITVCSCQQQKSKGNPYRRWGNAMLKSPLSQAPLSERTAKNLLGKLWKPKQVSDIHTLTQPHIGSSRTRGNYLRLCSQEIFHFDTYIMFKFCHLQERRESSRYEILLCRDLSHPRKPIQAVVIPTRAEQCSLFWCSKTHPSSDNEVTSCSAAVCCSSSTSLYSMRYTDLRSQSAVGTLKKHLGHSHYPIEVWSTPIHIHRMHATILSSRELISSRSHDHLKAEIGTSVPADSTLIPFLLPPSLFWMRK